MAIIIPLDGALMLSSVSQQIGKKVNGKLNHLGINVAKQEYRRAALKDNRRKIFDEFFFGNNSQEILELIERTHNHGTKM